MRTLLVVAVFLAVATWLLLQNPASPPDTALHERLAKDLGRPRKTGAPGPTPFTPPPAPAPGIEQAPPPPPPLGERVPAEGLRGEAMRPANAASVASARRVDRWVVYAASTDRGDGPRLNPLVGQSAVILDGTTLFAAHALHSKAGAIWIVELKSVATPVARAGDAPATLVAAGAAPRTCVLARGTGRCLVFAAAKKTETLTLRFDFKEVEVTAFTSPTPGAAAGELARLPRPGAVQVTAAGATFASALPADLPEWIGVLDTPAVGQSIGTVDVDGTAVPLIVRFGDHKQVAGRLTLTTLPRPASGGGGIAIESLVPGNVLPALGAAGLVHSVPEVTP